MKRTVFYYLSAALLVLLVTAGSMWFQSMRALFSGNQLSDTCEDSLGALRICAVTTHELRSEGRGMPLLVRNWRRSKEVLGESLKRLDNARLSGFGELSGEFARLKAVSGQLIRQADEMEQELDAVGFRHLTERIGGSGLMVFHTTLLISNEANEQDLATSGMLLQRLKRHLQQIEMLDLELKELNFSIQKRLEIDRKVARSDALLTAILIVAWFVVLVLRIRDQGRETRVEQAARHDRELSERAHKEELRILFDSIGEAVLTVDAEGAVLRMNPSAETFTGSLVQEVIGKSVFSVLQLFPVRNAEAPMQLIRRVLAEGGSLSVTRCTLVSKKDGCTRLVTMGVSSLCNLAGRLYGAVIVFKDVTEESATELRVRHELKRDSLEKLAGGVAQVLGNGLQGLRANIAFLQDPATTSREAAECLDQLDQGVRRLGLQSRRLLSVARRQALRIQDLDALDVLERLKPSLQRILGPEVEMVFKFQSELPPMRVDASLFELIILELVKNAHDAMGDSGHLGISLQVSDFARERVEANTVVKCGRFVQVAISDTGHGMDAETLALAFDPYFTTKPGDPEAGLGLAVVQGLVLQHGGFIHAYSEPGAGTTMRVYLPASGLRPTIDSLYQETGDKPNLGKGRLVLFADDDVGVRGMAVSAFKAHGFEIMAAADGEELCEIAALHGGKAVAAVVDLVMPRLGGVDTARRLKALNPGLVVVHCTGHSRVMLEPAIKEGVCDRVVEKPYTGQALVAILVEELEKRRK